MTIPKFIKNIKKPFIYIEEYTIEDFFTPIKTTNKNILIKNVITNSAEYGLIPQKKFFEKNIVVDENINKYTIIKNGDFVYNPRKSASAPYGPFNCYTLIEPGIVSPLYFCIRPKNTEYIDYLTYYFLSPIWYSYIYRNGNQGGARHDRVGMTYNLLMKIPIKLPNTEGIGKITKLFKTCDKRIKNQCNKISTLEVRKRGLLKSIFSKKIRFKTDDNKNFQNWETSNLSYYLYENKDRNKANTYSKSNVLSVTKDYGVVNQIEYFGKSKAGEKVTDYHIVYNNNVIYTKSPLAKQPYGIIKTSNQTGIVSTLYAVYHCYPNVIPQFIDYYFSIDDTLNKYLKPLVNIGAKHDMKINNEDVLSGLVSFPTSLEEQQKIVNFFIKIDQQILIEKKKLEAMKLVKKGLLQQIFI